VNHAERNEQIRKEFEDLQKRGLKVREICKILSEKSYIIKISPIRIFDIVYREQPETDTIPPSDQIDIFDNPSTKLRDHAN